MLTTTFLSAGLALVIALVVGVAVGLSVAARRRASARSLVGEGAEALLRTRLEYSAHRVARLYGNLIP